ncbi:hypothetical protein PHISCL_08443 [Aspergillus sclerotialis]|uniref:Uncharacterized protein n=1 Tax=Aspergillus sclerotialis TaxID=2070753 RepID=A0A3A2Z7Z7_9EURO|nr:hypothetical protein PHISCL_08443 [Aspergillus sclerotialis]
MLGVGHPVLPKQALFGQRCSSGSCFVHLKEISEGQRHIHGKTSQLSGSVRRSFMEKTVLDHGLGLQTEAESLKHSKYLRTSRTGKTQSLQIPRERRISDCESLADVHVFQRRRNVEPMDMRATQALCTGNKFGSLQSGQGCGYAFIGHNKGHVLPRV